MTTPLSERSGEGTNGLICPAPAGEGNDLSRFLRDLRLEAPLERERNGKLNRLAGSGSPYLLQHAANPVDWHPWSPEAFSLARSEDKPVFLSVGYSTCHWCHVMERESFSDPGIASLMNELFVCIKVDREERPDIDHHYMTVCQLLTGSGGWPLTIVMTPDRKPFFAGTYFPPDDRYGRPGMLQILPQIRDLWVNERSAVDLRSEEIASGLQVFMVPDRPAAPSTGLVGSVYSSLRGQYDQRYGGFGPAPKFPMFSNLLFLLRYWHRTGEPGALSMVRHTLTAMRRGGIYDHVGYGLHRYSTDERWFAPHFEKMLYDQALAVKTCADLFRATGEEEARIMAEEIIAYVLRDLASPEGGFYSAEDADSEGEEGRFYTWSVPELIPILDEEEMRFVREVSSVTDAGNHHSETGALTGRNILFINPGSGGLPDHGARDGRGPGGISGRIREKLLSARSGRTRPLRDEKILTDWNGLMIAALASAAGAFGHDGYADAALRAFTYVRENLTDASGALLHVRYGRKTSIKAFLDDYACLLWACLELHQASLAADHFRTALDLAEEMVDLFWDQENGGFFFTREEGDLSVPRSKHSFDGPMPSGNAIASLCLLRLGRLAARRDLEEKGLGTLEAFASEMAGNPSGHTFMASALDAAHNGTAEVVIAAGRESSGARQLVRTLQRSYLPEVALLWVDPDDPDPAYRAALPFAPQKVTIRDRPTVYICRDFACQPPITDAGEVLRALSPRRDPGP